MYQSVWGLFYNSWMCLCDCLFPLLCTQTTVPLFIIPQEEIFANAISSHKENDLINLVCARALRNQSKSMCIY